MDNSKKTMEKIVSLCKMCIRDRSYYIEYIVHKTAAVDIWRYQIIHMDCTVESRLCRKIRQIDVYKRQGITCAFLESSVSCESLSTPPVYVTCAFTPATSSSAFR